MADNPWAGIGNLGALDQKLYQQPPVTPAPGSVPEDQQPLAQTPQQQQKRAIPERANAPTGQRPNGKRIITRNSFEIFEDQMDSLRRLAFEDKMAGKGGSQSAMVRAAIDIYLEKRKKK